MGKNQATLIINDREYKIVSDNSPEQLNRIAFTLNQKLKALSAEGADIRSRDLLVLTALNVVDDYLKAYDSLKELRIRMSAMQNELSAAEIEKAMDSAEMNKLNDYQKSAEREMRELRESVHMLSVENEHLRDEMEKLKNRLDSTEALEAENTALRQEISEYEELLTKGI